MSTPHLTPDEADELCEQLALAEARGLLVPTGEEARNPYLQAAYRGTGSPLASTWNVKVYTPKRGTEQCAVVCNDLAPLQHIRSGKWANLLPSQKTVVTIDDAGWGFPLCGVAVGVCTAGRVEVAEIPVDVFRHTAREPYLQAYARLGQQVLSRFAVSPATHRIEICTGWVNTQLRDELRQRGWEVQVAKITGQLQDELEQRFAEIVQAHLGAPLYYDPKAIGLAEVPRRYAAAVAYGQQHCPQLLKTGWQALAAYRD